MVFLIGKEITYTVNGKEHQLHQGDFLFIWPGELHAVLPNQQPDILICQFNSLLLDTIKNAAEKQLYASSESPPHLPP